MEQATKKKHTAVYLPPELLRRLARYQLEKEATTYGRNRLIIQAIDEYLKKRNR